MDTDKLAIGYGFNKPESTLHIKGNMIVSSNININGDYFKLTTNRNDNKSIFLNSTGGMTMNLNSDLIETIGNDRTTVINNNLIETVLGTSDITISGVVNETYKKNRNIEFSCK